MIRVVLDANILLSGMLGMPSPSRRIINLALAKKILIYGSASTYQEFCEIIQRPRIQKYLKKQLFSPDKIILDYRAFVNMVEPDLSDKAKRFVLGDPDDDEYVRVARACHARIIVTGDKHLLDHKKFEKILTVKPARFLEAFEKTRVGKLAK